MLNLPVILYTKTLVKTCYLGLTAAERLHYRELFDLTLCPYLVSDVRGITREACRHATQHLLNSRPTASAMEVNPCSSNFCNSPLRMRCTIQGPS